MRGVKVWISIYTLARRRNFMYGIIGSYLYPHLILSAVPRKHFVQIYSRIYEFKASLCLNLILNVCAFKMLTLTGFLGLLSLCGSMEMVRVGKYSGPSQLRKRSQMLSWDNRTKKPKRPQYLLQSPRLDLIYRICSS